VKKGGLTEKVPRKGTRLLPKRKREKGRLEEGGEEKEKLNREQIVRTHKKTTSSSEARLRAMLESGQRSRELIMIK